MFNLTKTELQILRKLSTPKKIQDFLDSIPMNFEEEGDTCLSPRRVLRERRAHCMEGAMLAALALRMHGHKPLVMDLKTTKGDMDHIVTLFQERGYWGAISKTNHGVLRYREPIYRTLRELALSYFHEYFLNENGKKTLRSFSAPVDLSRFDRRGWMTDEDDVFYIPEAIDDAKHSPLLSPVQSKNLRPADDIERAMGRLIEWTGTQKKPKRQFVVRKKSQKRRQ